MQATPGDVSAVAFCGLCCAECPSHMGTIADLARDLRKELRRIRFEKTASFLADIPYFKEFGEYDACYRVLGRMVTMRCRKRCRGGGGPPFCKMRTCCARKGIDGCWECDAFETCELLAFLNPSHGDAHIRNLRALKRKGLEGFLAGEKHWYSKPRQNGRKRPGGKGTA